MNLKGLAPLGIPINKLGGQARNLPRMIDEAFHSDNHMLVFPAGLCSRKINGKIQDLPWGKAFITKSRQTGRDIIPIHFEGKNSERFYRIANLQKMLGLKFNVAMMFLPDEMYKSTGRKYKITFGKPIPIDSLDNSKNDAEWAQDIRKSIYEL
jgi:putative hemolysin